MSSRDLVARATALRDAAFGLRDAVDAEEPAELDAALVRRNEAFAALQACVQAPLDPSCEALVREVLEIDRETEQRMRAGMDRLRDELEQIRHARAVAGRQQRRADAPRYVSRRA